MKPIAKLVALPLVLSLVSCAHVGDAGMTLMASSVGAVGVVQDTLLLGKVVLLTNRSGTVNLAEPAPAPAPSAVVSTAPRLSCSGSLHYTATTTGVISLRCSDGMVEGLAFTALSATRGVASGSTARGPISLVFGMAPADAVGILTPPEGQRLVLDAKGQPQLQPL